MRLKQTDMLDWYVFYTVSRHEKKVAELLAKNGYDVFLPLVTELKQWSDRKKKVQSPLFKSYIFVHISEAQISTVCGFSGISFAIKNGKSFAKIKRQEVEAIRLLLSSGIYAEAIPGDIAEGDSVLISEGPLKGIAGKCSMVGTQNYFYIEIPSVNHLIRIKIHSSALRKVD